MTKSQTTIVTILGAATGIILLVLTGVALYYSFSPPSPQGLETFPTSLPIAETTEPTSTPSPTLPAAFTSPPSDTPRPAPTAFPTPTRAPAASGKIAFASNRGGDFDIYVMGTDGTGPIQLTSSPAIEESPAWSPDGSRIAFISDRDGDVEIYAMDVDGSGQVRLTDSPGFDGDPTWSPDGEHIAFSSLRDGNSEIYVMNADGTNPVRLTNNKAHDWRATWSPDGTQIAFVSERDGDAEIYVMNADGTGQTNLTNFAFKVDESYPDRTSNERDPAWSPDGQRIAFTSDRDSFVDDQGSETLNTEIYVMNVNGADQTRLTRHVAWDESPTWSPDSEYIAFITSVDAGGWEVYRMNADGSNLANLTINPADDVSPAWSP